MYIIIDCVLQCHNLIIIIEQRNCTKGQIWYILLLHKVFGVCLKFQWLRHCIFEMKTINPPQTNQKSQQNRKMPMMRMKQRKDKRNIPFGRNKAVISRQCLGMYRYNILIMGLLFSKFSLSICLHSQSIGSLAVVFIITIFFLFHFFNVMMIKCGSAFSIVNHKKK